MTVVRDNPETPSPLGMTGESDWETLLQYTGEITEEVVRSWWADVPVSAWPDVKQQLAGLEKDDPELGALVRRVTGL